MSTDSVDIITQAQLSVGSDLMANAAMAAHISNTYMQDFKRRLALGGRIEPGPLTFKPEQMCVRHTYC
jgi:hypothetical protein